MSRRVANLQIINAAIVEEPESTFVSSVCKGGTPGGGEVVGSIRYQTWKLFPGRASSLWGPFDIPTVRYSDSSIFRQFDIPTVRYSDSSIFRQLILTML